MSRTKRNQRSVFSIYRRPKGAAKYRAMNERSKAIPPDSWDDIAPNPETDLPLKAMKRMKQKKVSREEAIAKVQKKWGLTHDLAEKLAKWVYG